MSPTCRGVNSVPGELGLESLADPSQNCRTFQHRGNAVDELAGREEFDRAESCTVCLRTFGPISSRMFMNPRFALGCEVRCLWATGLVPALRACWHANAGGLDK